MLSVPSGVSSANVLFLCVAKEKVPKRSTCAEKAPVDRKAIFGPRLRRPKNSPTLWLWGNAIKGRREPVSIWQRFIDCGRGVVVFIFSWGLELLIHYGYLSCFILVEIMRTFSRARLDFGGVVHGL